MVNCLFSWTLIILFFGGCALHKPFSGKEERTAAQMMKEGLINLDKGHYKAAVREFEKIRDRYPYSEFAAEAMLKMADALYKGEQYSEAFYAYNEFEMLHHRNPYIPYAIYQKGMSLLNEVSDVDRGQMLIIKARKEFEHLVRVFPRSEYAGKARDKIRECYTYLAEHELYVGHFYFKMKKYLAAMGRYRYVIDNYPDLAPYKEALEYLSKCEENLSKGQKVSDLTPQEQKRIVSPQKQEEINLAKTLKPVDDRPVINAYSETPAGEDTVSEQETDNFPQGQEQFSGAAEQDDSIIAFHKGEEDGLPKADQDIERLCAPGMLYNQSRELTQSLKKPEFCQDRVLSESSGKVAEKMAVPVVTKTAKTIPVRSSSGKKIFSVQVGAFLVKENAEKFVADLTRKGYRPYIFKTSGYRKRQWYSVRISDHTDLQEASNTASGFKSKEGSPSIVTAIDSLDPVTLKLE